MSGAMLAGLGWQIAAQVVSDVFGTTWAQYRPTGATAPISSATLINAALPGFVTPDAYASKPKPLDPAKPRAHGVFNPASLAIGDYLTGSLMQGGSTETFYVAQISAPAPPSVIRCNAVLNVTRTVAPSSFGAQVALDDQAGTETVVVQGWPGSMLREGRGERGDTGLPGDVKLGGFIVLLPPTLPGVLRSGDVITNTGLNEVRAIVAMAELTPDGWKLLVQEAAA